MESKIMKYTLEQLKAIAKSLDVTYSPNIGYDKLLEKITTRATELDVTIEEVIEQLEIVTEEPTPSTDKAPVIVPKVDEEVERLRNLTFEGAELIKASKESAERVKDAMKLTRCTLSCNDKNKSSYPSEIWTVGNAVIPTVKKCVPFGVTTHVPQIMLNTITEAEHQIFTTRKNVNNVPVQESRIIAAYNTQVLPPITRDELEAIKRKQLAEGFNGE